MLGSLEEDRTINQSLTTPFLKEFKSTKSVDFVAKVLIVGDSRAGKTCLFRRFSDDLFNENYRKTGAVEFRHRYLHTRECKTKIQVWDCVSSASHISTQNKEIHRRSRVKFLQLSLSPRICWNHHSEEAVGTLSIWILLHHRSAGRLELETFSNHARLASEPFCLSFAK